MEGRHTARRRGSSPLCVRSVTVAMRRDSAEHPRGRRAPPRRSGQLRLEYLAMIWPNSRSSCEDVLDGSRDSSERSRVKIDVERFVGRLRSTSHSTRPPNRTIRLSLSVITAGQRRCPRQDSNLRSRLRRPVDLVITDVFWRPTWACASRAASPVTSCGLWFVPRSIPRRVSSLDEFEALVLGEVGVVFDVARRGAFHGTTLGYWRNTQTAAETTPPTGTRR